MQINLCGCAPVKLYLQNQEVGQTTHSCSRWCSHWVFLDTQVRNVRCASTESFGGKYQIEHWREHSIHLKRHSWDRRHWKCRREKGGKESERSFFLCHLTASMAPTSLSRMNLGRRPSYNPSHPVSTMHEHVNTHTHTPRGREEKRGKERNKERHNTIMVFQSPENCFVQGIVSETCELGMASGTSV